MNGFENTFRDNIVSGLKEDIGAGCKLKIDDNGDILVKRLARSNIYIRSTTEEHFVSKRSN